LFVADQLLRMVTLYVQNMFGMSSFGTASFRPVEVFIPNMFHAGGAIVSTPHAAWRNGLHDFVASHPYQG
jgi:hypothetical protein